MPLKTHCNIKRLTIMRNSNKVRAFHFSKQKIMYGSFGIKKLTSYTSRLKVEYVSVLKKESGKDQVHTFRGADLREFKERFVYIFLLCNQYCKRMKTMISSWKHLNRISQLSSRMDV